MASACWRASTLSCSTWAVPALLPTCPTASGSSVATDNSTSSFSLSVDGKVAVEKVALSGTSLDNFSNVKANITLPEGKHVLRMDVTGAGFDIDYFNFVEGKDAPDPDAGNGGGDNPGQGGDNPGQGGDNPGQAIQTRIHMETPVLGAYDVFDVNGVRLGRMRAYTMEDAVQILKTTSDIKTQGIYLLRSARNGVVKSVRVVR